MTSADHERFRAELQTDPSLAVVRLAADGSRWLDYRGHAYELEDAQAAAYVKLNVRVDDQRPNPDERARLRHAAIELHNRLVQHHASAFVLLMMLEGRPVGMVPASPDIELLRDCGCLNGGFTPAGDSYILAGLTRLGAAVLSAHV